MISNPSTQLSASRLIGLPPEAGGGPEKPWRDRPLFSARERHPNDYAGYRWAYPFFSDIIDHLEGLPAKTFLDLGSTSGELLKMIGQHRKGARLYGLDRPGRMVPPAGERPADRPNIMAWDGRTIPLDDNRIDVVVSSRSFHYPNPLKMLAEIRRVLKDCGRLVLPACKLPWSVCTLANAMIGNATERRIKLYSKNQILDLLDEAGFHFEKWTDIGNYGFVVSAMVVKPDD